MNVTDHVMIETLRHRVSDVLQSRKDNNVDFGTDFDLLRWLQGFDNNVDEAARYLRRHIEFRRLSGYEDKDFRPNPVYKEGIAHCTPDPPVWTKEGLYLYVEFLGKMDHVGLMRHKNTNWVDLFKYRLQEIERVHRIVRLREEVTGKQSGVYLVWDMQGYKIGTSLSNIIMMSKAVRHVGEFFAHHQVELVKRVVVIHPPPMFHTLWTMVAPLVPSKYGQKVKILHGSNWLQDFAEDFNEPSELPDFLGGTLPHSQMDNSICHIPKERIPLSEYFNKAAMKGNPDLQTERFAVSAGRALVASFHKTGTSPQSVRWIIFTNAACHFGVFRLSAADTDGAETHMEIPKAIYPVITPLPASQYCPEMDKLEISEAGHYEIRLVNHASYNIFGKLHADIRVDLDGDAGSVEYVIRELSSP